MEGVSNSNQDVPWFLVTVQHLANSGTEEDRHSLQQIVINFEVPNSWRERINPLIKKIEASNNNQNYRHIEISNMAQGLLETYCHNQP